MKAIFHSPDHVIIVAGVLLKDTVAPCLLIISLDYILETSTDLIKENYFTLKMVKKADDIPQKIWLTKTTRIIPCFSHMHLSKQNPYCIVFVKQQETETLCESK